MPFRKFHLVKGVLTATGLSIWLLFAKSHAQPAITNSTKTTMKTNLVDRAMGLIRQRKFAEAREILVPAAEMGEAEPQALLGQIYNAGWGVPVDYGQAFKWWSLAAEKGSTDAQWGLGLLYDEGDGVPRDSKKAAALWKKASENGNVKATINLAFLYEEGRGVTLDLKESTRLFGVAAKRGEPGAQLNYGLRLISGDGIEQNQVLGCAWIGVAAESPHIQGTQYGERIISQKEKTWSGLSAVDREKAEKLKKEIQSTVVPFGH